MNTFYVIIYMYFVEEKMRSTNPIFREKVFEEAYSLTERPMTVSGTLNKLLLLTVIMLVAAMAVFYQFYLQHFDYVNILMVAGGIIGFIAIFVIFFNQKLTPYLAPIYAFAQGAVISGISCIFEASFPGIVMQAISMTMLTVFVMAMLFKTRIIKVTDKLRSTIMIATITVAVFYIISFILMLLSVNVPYFTSTSTLSIVLNVAIAILAAFNLLLDFDFIERGSKAPLPSHYEWYGAFGLLVTILWLYVEVLRLLARLRDR